ncbi:fluoride efflux transporter CrcB [Puniceicoccaceae bacterium K14]|nr:fluoride efflux transporter CrcB [Puniceicoccaceae bacterium K14]
MDLKSIVFVGLGSFFGGSFRYVLSYVIDHKLESSFPWSILAINALGSFLIGFATALFTVFAWGRGEPISLFVTVGMLGGFTTFSTFSLQTLKLLQAGQIAAAGLNVTLSILVCLLFVFLGMKLGQSMA